MLLDRLQREGASDPAARLKVFAGFAAEMRELGSANFLFFDGDQLFVHADRRRFETEDGLTEPREPGLTMRKFDESHCGDRWESKGATINEISSPLHLFASVPLDPEGWEPLPRGTAMAVKDGRIIGHATA